MANTLRIIAKIMIKNKYQSLINITRKNKKILVKIFKYTFRIISKKYKKNDTFSLMDAGCASGFLIDYLSSKFRQFCRFGLF